MTQHPRTDASTLRVLVQALDRILFEITAMHRAIDAAEAMDAGDRREMKRRVILLSAESDALLRWVCDQRDFDHPHN